MKNIVQAVGVAVFFLSCLAGCAQEDRARGILCISQLPGLPPAGQTDEFTKSMPGMSPSETLKKLGRIDVAETVALPDKTPIDVWVIKARDASGKPAASSNGTVVVLHAYTDGRASYPTMGVGERLAKKGYDVVLPSLRKHGFSGGEAATFGVKEKDDLRRIIDKFVLEKVISDKVYVFGVGYGGLVGIQYAALDPRVKGVVAITPYKDFRSFVRQNVGLMGEGEFQNLIEACGKLGSFNPDDASAVKAAGKLSCPLLVVHGILDLSVPMEWSQAIVDAAKTPKKLYVVGVEVALAVAVYEDWLAGQVDSLIKNGLPAETPATKPAGA